MKDSPSPSDSKKPSLADILKERALRVAPKTETTSDSFQKSWEERQREFALRAWVDKRRVVQSRDSFAREQTMADWLEVPLPTNEKQGIQSVADVLVQLIPKLNLKTSSLQPEELSEGWKRAAGDFISHNAQLVKLEKGAATIKVLQPTLRYQLNQMKPALLEKLQAEFPSIKINTIHFIYG